jgi:mercuric ion binding protein
MIRMLGVAIAAVILFGCQRAEQQAQNVATAFIEVKTIQCEMCVKSIENAVKNIDGVKRVEVDLQKKVATIQFVPGKSTLDVLEMAITKTGYDANAKKRDETAYAELPTCCR